MRRIVIIRLPFRGPTDEFLPLRGDPSLDCQWMHPSDFKGDADVIVLPGSGATMNDLAYLRETGGEQAIQRHLSRGGVVVGVCGGFQILGRELFNPLGGEGDSRHSGGLGWLPMSTVFGPEMLKSTTSAKLLVGTAKGGDITGEERRSGFSWATGPTRGFETLHSVEARKLLSAKPQSVSLSFGRNGNTSVNWCPGDEREDGFVSADRKVWGTYFHLIFHNEAFLRTFFASLNP